MAHLSFNPFLFYSMQLQSLLDKANEQENPALWLHKNKVRTVLFMLEALTRLHKNAFDEKLFEKWNKRFKKLEDVFGEIDQYLSIEAELKLNKKVSKEIIKYFTVNASNYIEKCNQRLREKKWLDNKLQSFNYKLSEFNVEYNQEYLDELKYTMFDEIDSILIFSKKSNYQFTKIEEEIHELRRKLRWLSIYAQSLNGLVQLKQSKSKAKFQQKYFTKEILNSSYSKLEKRPKNTAIIEFDYDSFFALSWMISKLGDLKDSGIKVQKLTDAVFVIDAITKEEANKKAIALLGFKDSIQKDVLSEASKIIETFFIKDDILNSLIIE